MVKIVVNACYGGFRLSPEAREFLHARGKDEDVARDDADLVAAVETLGEAAAGGGSELVVVELPDGTEWQIVSYDGQESLTTPNRTL